MIGYFIVFCLGFAAPKIRKMLRTRVVKFCDGYAVRRWILTCEHLGRTENYWWTATRFKEKYCVFPTKEKAQQRLDQYRAQNPSLLCKAKRSFYKWLKSSC